MTKEEQQIVYRLDYLYEHDPVEYEKTLAEVKYQYRVYRNSLGKHKLQSGLDFLKQMFGMV